MKDQQILELLSEYIDGQLSERQETEIKRLIAHDENIARNYRKISAQKKLLNSMPKATAPKGLADDVRARLERKLILQEYETTQTPSAGHRHLLLRKLTAAAAVMTLIGLMAIVVVNILTPARQAEQFALEDVTNKYINSAKLPPEEDLTALADSVDHKIFHAELAVKVLDVVSMNEYLQKVFYNNDLIDRTVPVRNPRFSRYIIKADKNRVNMLLTDLDSVWDKFSDVRLTIFGERPDSSLIANDLKPQDITAILNNRAEKDYVEIARDYVRQKELIDSLPGTDMVRIAYDVATEKPEPVRPALASGAAEPANELANEQAKEDTSSFRPAVNNVKFVITVIGL